MRLIPHFVRRHLANKRKGLAARPNRPVPPIRLEGHGRQFWRPRDHDSYFAETNALDSRVLIIEGISGSGKDTFQTYLKTKLRHRDVYDYSEGEVLHSWKHFPIEGILKLRIEFMKLFVNHLKHVLAREKNAVFLLNRFHLSAYVTTISRQPELTKEYEEIINALRTLHVHIFILMLDESQISRRSNHVERSSIWQKIQEQMVAKDGSRDKFERYLSQQQLILEVAKRQQIPFSALNFHSETQMISGWPHKAQSQTILGHTRPSDAKIPASKRNLS